jgi:hypothetical protein
MARKFTHCDSRITLRTIEGFQEVTPMEDTELPARSTRRADDIAGVPIKSGQLMAEENPAALSAALAELLRR